jgi:hypothetical protein
MQTSQQDTISRNDNDFEHLNCSSTALKRRAIYNSGLLNNRTSSDRLSPTPKIVHSRSTNGLNNSTIKLNEMIRENTHDSLDILSLNRQTKPIFDIITDQQFDNNGSTLDDRKSQISDSTYDYQQSILSPTSRRKQLTSSRLFRSFHNLRFRKKNNTS